MRKTYQILLPLLLVCLVPMVASAQNTTTAQGGGAFMVQCPSTTPFHPTASNSGDSEPDYTGPTPLSPTLNGITFNGAANTNTQLPPYVSNGGQIKCQEISGGDGFMTEADGNQTFMFSFGPLSGLDNIKHGLPGTLLNADFNNPCTPTGSTTQVNCYYNSPTLPSNCGAGTPASCAIAGAAGIVAAQVPLSTVTDPTYDPAKPTNTNAGIADPATIMTIGVMNGNIPGPLSAIDEDDEFFLTLSNVGMIMRPDLFEQHTVHFHGYPNASSYYDGVPDATWAINIGGSATYYYLAPDAGTYFWHCHITPPEHLQMGMVSQIYVRPRQNRVPVNHSLYASLAGGSGLPNTDASGQQSDLRTACHTETITHQDILCSVPLPQADSGFHQQLDPFIGSGAGKDGRIAAGTRLKYVYNDGDGSTWYDVEVPLQLHGFDPNFHFVGMTFNPEGFADMKDKYFLFNGRSYPDTIAVPGYNGLPGPTSACAGDPHAYNGNPDICSGAIGTEDSDGRTRFSQPLSTLVRLVQGERAALRIANLAVTEYQTLASLGLPMTMVGYQAKILRDQAGNNLFIKTNSINLGGGESLDAILDSCLVRDPANPLTCTTPVPTGTYFLYSPILDRLSNDAENFGGAMTEVLVCSSIDASGTCTF